MSNGSDDTPPVKVFISSLSVNKEIKLQQQRIIQTLDSKKIVYEKKDIAVDQQAKREFRRLMRGYNPNATTPQISNKDFLCGDYEAFYWAVEEEKLHDFLRLVAPVKQKPEQATIVRIPSQSVSNPGGEKLQSTIADPTEQKTFESEEVPKGLSLDSIPPPPPVPLPGMNPLINP